MQEEKKSVFSAWWLWVLIIVVVVLIIFAILKITKKPEAPKFLPEKEVVPRLEKGLPLPPTPGPAPKTP